MFSLHLNCKQLKLNDRNEMKIFRFFYIEVSCISGNSNLEKKTKKQN